jgi:GH24 family phage-related lysozyme (muramidase)
MTTYSPSVISRAIAQATGISKPEEGLSLVAYPDPGTGGEPWTIGYGSTRIYGRAVLRGDVITQVQALAMLQEDLDGSLQVVTDNVSTLLNGDQLGALTSFVNNVGPGIRGVRDGFVWLADGKHSTMFEKLAAGDFAGAALEFPKWNRGGGRVLPGLVKRRALEVEVFNGTLDMTGYA